MATEYEVSDTTTAYLALSARCPHHPHRDLMLLWGEQDGWVVALETDPGEEPVVLAYHGEDILPGAGWRVASIPAESGLTIPAGPPSSFNPAQYKH